MTFYDLRVQPVFQKARGGVGKGLKGNGGGESWGVNEKSGFGERCECEENKGSGFEIVECA